MGDRSVGETSENRWFDANRFRGGRGYGSGSGSVIRSEGPRRQMQDFESWVRGELRWRNRKLYQTEGAMDFRERVSRSIWPSKLGLSSYRILPARGILSFGGKVRLLLYASAGWEESVFCRRSPLSRCVFKRSICRGGPSVLSQTRKQRSAFFEHLSARVCGCLRQRRVAPC